MTPATKRTTSAAITVLVFLGAIVAWATFQARGNPFTHADFAWTFAHQPLSAMFAALSLAAVALAGWIAAALAGRPLAGSPLVGSQARRAMLLGWLATLPTLIGVVAVVLDVTDLSAMMLGDPLEDPDTYHRLPARIVNVTRFAALLLGFTLPFSAGVVIFGLAYPIAMAARWGWRLMQRRRAPM
jgi:hypothetical protein